MNPIRDSAEEVNEPKPRQRAKQSQPWQAKAAPRGRWCRRRWSSSARCGQRRSQSLGRADDALVQRLPSNYHVLHGAPLWALAPMTMVILSHDDDGHSEPGRRSS